MKVLFVASNPPTKGTLNLEREITELQRRFTEASGDPVSFVFLPNLHAEDFPAALARHRPDILHISAHGDDERLSLMNQAEKEVPLDATALATFLPPNYPPRLVYLNACDSQGIAKALSAYVPMAIGSTAPITNRAARAGAVAFYERVLSGEPVQHAFEVAQKMIEILHSGQVSAVLHAASGVNPDREVLHRSLRLIADFVNGIPNPKKGNYSVHFGLVGCPGNTTQVVFFTDYEALIDYAENSLETDLCAVVRGTPSRNVVWQSPDEAWAIDGNFRLFAVGVTGDGHTFSVGSTLCDAIETRYRLAPEREIPTDIAMAVAELRRADGADLDYAPERRKRFGNDVAAPMAPDHPTAGHSGISEEAGTGDF